MTDIQTAKVQALHALIMGIDPVLFREIAMENPRGINALLETFKPNLSVSEEVQNISGPEIIKRVKKKKLIRLCDALCDNLCTAIDVTKHRRNANAWAGFETTYDIYMFLIMVMDDGWRLLDEISKRVGAFGDKDDDDAILAFHAPLKASLEHLAKAANNEIEADPIKIAYKVEEALHDVCQHLHRVRRHIEAGYASLMTTQSS